MKKFTFLLSMLLIMFVLNAQNKNNLQKEIQQAQEKFSRISQKTALLTKLTQRQALNKEFVIKSAATKQKLDSTVNRILNTDTQLWHYDYKDEFIYDSELKNTSYLEKEWNLTTKTWDIRSKTEMGYDNLNRINLMKMYATTQLKPSLTLNGKFVVFYNSQGLQDSTLSYSTENEGTSWVLDMKQINFYNAAKQLLKQDVWALDENLGTLILSFKMVYTYTDSGKIKTSSSSSIMEGVEMLWSKTEYNYDTSGILASSEDWEINFMTLTLEKSSRTLYQYNASGDVSVEIYSSWNGTSWVDEEKDESIYSTTNFSDVIFPSFIFIFGGNEPGWSMSKQITGVNIFEKINGNWINNGKTVFYYSNGTSTNITEFGNTLFTVYPNPASEHVNFNWKGNYESLLLEMYQITGAKVMEQITYSGKPVSISKLENGVYFYKLLNGQQMVHTGKMIKR